jgi:hypothetical protein
MKRIIQGLVLATLITTAQASPFPNDGELVALPAQWTHADRNPVAGNMTESSFPAGDSELVALPAESTYADRNAGSISVQTGGTSIGGDGELVALPAQSTYAERFAMERGFAPTQAALSE